MARKGCPSEAKYPRREIAAKEENRGTDGNRKGTDAGQSSHVQSPLPQS
jgi:hypothetical protein